MKEIQYQFNFQYHPGDQVLIVLDAHECSRQPKISAPTRGPFMIT
jgi:hypothetical protein